MRRLAMLVFVISLAACGAPDTSATDSSSSATAPARTLDQAASRLRLLLDSTAEELFPGIATHVQEDGTGRKQCNAESDTEDEDYSISVEVPVDQIDAAMEQARHYWEDQGREVRSVDARTDFPALFTNFDGYVASVQGSKARGRVYFVGSTPCFPAAEDDG